jgi:hypothetical protein
MGCRVAAGLLAFVLAGAAAAQQASPLQSVLAAPLATPVAEGIEAVVEGADGTPVANAIVAVLPAAWTAEQRAVVARLDAEHRGDANQRLAAIALQFGERHRGDERGRATVPAAARHVAAFAGEAAGELVLAGASTGPVRIRLLARDAVFVRAIGMDGKPVARVTVSLLDSLFPRATASTDARGECVLLADQHRANPEAVVAAIAGADVRAVWHEPFLPRTPLELRAPHFGFVRVLAYDEREQPRSDLRTVGIRAGDRQRIDVRADARGEFVALAALGQQFEIEVTLSGLTGTTTAKCAGPTRHGELVIGDVRAAVGPPVLVFRVLGIDGDAVPEGQLVVDLVRRGVPQGELVRAGADGRVRVTVRDRETVQRILVRRRIMAPDGWSETVAGGAPVPLPERWPPGEQELPDVRLQEEPVLASGVVVDDDGKPVPGVCVGAGASFAFDEKRPDRTVDVQLVRGVRPDAEGRFEMRDLREVAKVQLFLAFCPAGFEMPRLDVARGTCDVRLVLVRQGTVHLHLDGVPDTQHAVLHASLVPAGGAPNGIALKFVNGHARIRTASGTYALVLSLHRSKLEVARIPGVVVRRGAETDDPRLVPFAWRDHLLPVTITTVDETDRPVAGARLLCMFTHPDGGEGGGGGSTDANGRFFALVLKAGARFVCDGSSSSGGRYRPVERANVTTDQPFVLRAPLRVFVQLQGDRSLADATRASWHVQGHEEAPMWIGHVVGATSPAADGAWDLAFAAPGEFTLQAQFRVPRGERSWTIVTVRWGRIEVLETAELQTFAIAPDEQALQQLAALREQLGK